MQPLRISVFLSRNGWRWRLKAVNGRTVSTSGQRFASKSNALRAAKRLVGAVIVLEEA